MASKDKPADDAPLGADDEPLDPADDWQVSDSPALDADYAALRATKADDEALDRELAELTAKPGDDPYELDWPDEEKDARAQARAEKAEQAERRKAPRLVAAATAGIGVTLLFIVPVALVAGAPTLVFSAAMPIVLVGLLLGLPMLILIERVTARMRRGITELVLILVGGATGYGLTYVLATSLSAGQDGLETIRTVTSLFMLTATATGFLVAHLAAESFRRRPLAVWTTAGLLVVLALMGVFVNFFSTGA